MQDFTINKLVSGGLITNYNCTSKCQHCLYGCSSERDNSYINVEQCERVFRKIKSMGCYSIHIGGGEPLINVSGLVDVLNCANKVGVNIEYVETNSSWYKDDAQAEAILLRLRSAGLQMLLVSISPFHNEHIPFNKVKSVLRMCVNNGISVFPWTQEFYYDLAVMSESKTHTSDEYIAHFGKNYFSKIPNRYWIHYGGRSLSYFSAIKPLVPLADILTTDHCHELLDTSHFHIDLYGNYIPSLCVGKSIYLDDLGGALDKGRYPLIHTLLGQGIKGLYEYATTTYNFVAKPAYLNKCHLCSDIRSFFVLDKQLHLKELEPVEFYKHI